MAALRFFKFLFFAAIIAAFCAFAVANRGVMSISLFPLPYSVDIPTFLFALLCFAAGIITAGLALGLQMSRSHRRLAAEHKRVIALENEVRGWRAESPTQPALPPAKKSA